MSSSMNASTFIAQTSEIVSIPFTFRSIKLGSIFVHRTGTIDGAGVLPTVSVHCL